MITDITLDELGVLASLLHGNSDRELDRFRSVIYREVTPNDKLFSEVTREIILCPSCGGSEKRRAGNVREMHNMDIEACEKCEGGKRVKITSVRYVNLNDQYRFDFAR